MDRIQAWGKCTATCLGYAALLWLGWTILRVIVGRLLRKRVNAASFKGKRIMVTGASSGIGEAFAYELAKLGASLCLVARRADRLEEVARKCRWIQAEGLSQSGGRGAKPETVTVIGDVSSEADCAKAAQAMTTQLGGIDAVIANAGRGADGIRFEDCSLDVYKEIMDVNYWGVLHIVRHTLPAVRATRGALMVVSSTAGIFATSTRTGYSPTKAAVNSFCDSLRFEVAGDGVAVVCACPGYVVTEIHDKMLAKSGGRRNLSKFITSEQAAQIMLGALVNRDRQIVMFPGADVFVALRALLPTWLVDRLVARNSDAAFEQPGH